MSGLQAVANQRYAVANGDWNAPSTWSATSGTPGGAMVPTSDDTVFIGEGTAWRTVTIPAGYAAKCAAIRVGSTGTFVAGTAILFASSTSSLRVHGDVMVYQVGTRSSERLINVGAGTMLVDGSLILGEGVNSTHYSRTCRVLLGSGTINVKRDLVFVTIPGSDPVQCNLDLSGGAGTFTLAGDLVLRGGGAGTLYPGTQSTFVYNGTGVQLIPLGVSDIRYHHLTISNTSDSGAVLGGTIAKESVTGNVRILSGILRDGGNHISGSSSRVCEVGGGGTLVLEGTNGMPDGFGSTVLAPTSRVIFSGMNQIVAAIPYGHLTLAGTGTKTLPYPSLSIGGTFALSGTCRAVAQGALTIQEDVVIGEDATWVAGAGVHAVSGNWTDRGTFVAGSGTIQLTGSGNTTIGGSTTFSTLVIEKGSSAAVVTLQDSITVGTLTVNKGTLASGAHGIKITGARKGNGMVTGKVRRAHPFLPGTPYTFAHPQTSVTFAEAGVLPASFTVVTHEGSPASGKTMTPIKRSWETSQEGGTGFSYTLRLHYEDTDIAPPNSETDPPLRVWWQNPNAPDVWERIGATAHSAAENWVEVSGVTETGTWTLSSTTLPNVILSLSTNRTDAKPGEQVMYTITYANTGDGPYSNSIITAAVPPKMKYVTGQTRVNGLVKTDQGGDDEVTVSGSTITITLGVLAAGASGNVTYRAIVN